MAYEYQEFPRIVYGPGDETLLINREEERPDGFVNHPSELVSGAEQEAEIAKAEAAAVDRELREGYKAFLDKHDVVYAKNLSLAKLAVLVDQLEAHLAAKGSDDGLGE